MCVFYIAHVFSVLVAEHVHEIIQFYETKRYANTRPFSWQAHCHSPSHVKMVARLLNCGPRALIENSAAERLSVQ